MTTLPLDPNSPTTSPTPTSRTGTTTRRKSRLARWFHPTIGLLLIGLTVWGFHHFYLQGQSYPGRPITPPIRGLVIAHGVTMAGWLVMFFVQPLLVAIGKKKLHMTVGMFTAGLAVLVVVLGVLVGVNSARVSPPEMTIWGLHPKAFMAVPLISVTLFAAYIGVGIYYRRKPAIHRPMMVTGTFAAMSAAVSRIDTLSNLYIGTPFETVFGPFLVGQVVMGVLVLARCLMIRKVDRWFVFGFVSLTVANVLIMVLARSAAWDAFASLLVP